MHEPINVSRRCHRGCFWKQSLCPGMDLEWEGWEGQNKNGSLSVTSTPKPQLSILQGSKGKDGRPGRAPTVADQQRPRLLGVF